jgi:hypothetical protein
VIHAGCPRVGPSGPRAEVGSTFYRRAGPTDLRTPLGGADPHLSAYAPSVSNATTLGGCAIEFLVNRADG